jgi:ABC-type multidrug transport system fused ATPase/permease subunit
MRHHARPPVDAPANQSTRNDWGTLKTLLPYLWAYKWRVIFALLCLVFAKVANVAVPLVLKELIDGLTIAPDKPASLLILPAGLLIVYGLLRLSTTVFTELREFFFAKVTQRAVRTVALKVFRHLHALSLRFHLNRQTGGNSGSPVVNKDLELVGLIFDGNIQSLTADYVYSDAQSRAVSVHSSAIREALRQVYGAKELVEQLGK